MIIFAYKQSSTQTHTNSKTEAHSYPLWIVGERANKEVGLRRDSVLGRYGGADCERLRKLRY